MKIIRLYFIIVLTLLSICGCTKSEPDGDEFHPISIDTKGIHLNEIDQFTYSGDVPSSGIGFEIKGTGEFSALAYVSRVVVFDGTYLSEISFTKPVADGYQIASGNWGSILYLQSTPPYRIRVEILSNPDKESRIIQFTLGDGLIYTDIRLIQAGTS